MQAFIELGVIGGLSYLVMFSSMLVMSWRISRSNTASKETKTFQELITINIRKFKVVEKNFPDSLPSKVQ